MNDKLATITINEYWFEMPAPTEFASYQPDDEYEKVRIHDPSLLHNNKWSYQRWVCLPSGEFVASHKKVILRAYKKRKNMKLLNQIQDDVREYLKYKNCPDYEESQEENYSFCDILEENMNERNTCDIINTEIYKNIDQ
ncbi:hypothetical protein TRFO_26644 [Tritrichomonas foetus]|uniref:Uncharacterized protein n=1 Tax=Tritrichomonas foetus TaxID=1144522 RepID=A0A1J4K815_9EUKA|nr:hypothetical protein TRFO_26644 [Tritrichomonas foetus]|eukprot:OHT05573.1 hypothetical protein TRFO_26644 [Tritrichomonas foetus]